MLRNERCIVTIHNGSLPRSARRRVRVQRVMGQRARGPAMGVSEQIEDGWSICAIRSSRCIGIEI